MIRLIKMNIYRALHSKSTYILLVIVMGLALFTAYMESTDLDMMNDSYDMIEDSENIAMGITVQTPSIREDGTLPYILEFVCADIRCGILCIFITIFTVLFVNDEESSGFVKNIAGQVKRRWILYTSKIVVIMLFVLIFMIAYAVVQIMGLYIFMENLEFGYEMIGSNMIYVLFQWLLYSAFASGVAFAVTVLHSTPIGITWGLLSCLGMGTIISGFINKIVDINGFNLSDYFITENIKKLEWNGTVSEYTYALIVALVFITIYNLLSIVWVSKKDIKV